MSEEIKNKDGNGKLGEAGTPDLGYAGDPMKKPEPEIKKEQPKQPEQPKDFKIAEIWIKNDTVALDASPNFWMDKLRALGILEYCKEIVLKYNSVEKKIIRPPAHGLGGFRNIFKRKR